jgi:hypothetical protein
VLDIFFPPENRGMFDKKYKVCHNLNWSVDNKNNLFLNKRLPEKICCSPLVRRRYKKNFTPRIPALGVKRKVIWRMKI